LIDKEKNFHPSDRTRPCSTFFAIDNIFNISYNLSRKRNYRKQTFELKGCVKMQKILVSVNSVKRKLEEIESDNMEYVELNIVPGQTDSSYIYPAFLHLDGISKSGSRKDYESIDALPLKQQSYWPKLVLLHL
jgi:hypothetical protein